MCHLIIVMNASNIIAGFAPVRPWALNTRFIFPRAIRLTAGLAALALGVGMLHAESPAAPDDATHQDPVGLNKLGLRYEEGKGVSQDFAKAMRLYRAAAAGGNISALNNIGWLYERAKGVPRDYAQAMLWYRKAANGGLATAMNNIGLLYYTGLGVPQDYAQAASWFEKAAQAGDANGMCDLAVVYEHGEGVTQDPAAAQQWYQKAAAAGNATAKKWVAKRDSATPMGKSTEFVIAYLFEEGETHQQVQITVNDEPVVSTELNIKGKHNTVTFPVTVDGSGPVHIAVKVEGSLAAGGPVCHGAGTATLNVKGGEKIQMTYAPVDAEGHFEIKLRQGS